MDDFSSILSNFVSPKWTIFSTTLALAIFIRFRAKSIHSVFEHMWRLVAGKTEVKRGALKNFMEDTRDLERFRFVYGIKITSHRNLDILLKWLKNYDIEVGRVSRAWKWFKIDDEVTINIPSKHFWIGAASIFVFAAGFIYFGAWQLGSKETYIKFIDTDSWYAVTEKTIRRTWENERIDLQSCQNDEAGLTSKTKLTEHDASIFCNVVRNGHWEAELTKLHHEQQGLGGVSLFLGLCGFAWAFLRQRAADEAVALDKLVKGATPMPQSSPDPGQIAASIPAPKPRRPRTPKKPKSPEV